MFVIFFFKFEPCNVNPAIYKKLWNKEVKTRRRLFKPAKVRAGREQSAKCFCDKNEIL